MCLPQYTQRSLSATGLAIPEEPPRGKKDTASNAPPYACHNIRSATYPRPVLPLLPYCFPTASLSRLDSLPLNRQGSSCGRVNPCFENGGNRLDETSLQGKMPRYAMLVPSERGSVYSSRRAVEIGRLAARMAGARPPRTPMNRAKMTPFTRSSVVILNANARCEKV